MHCEGWRMLMYQNRSLICCNIYIYLKKVTSYKSGKTVQIWKTIGSNSMTQRRWNIFFFTFMCFQFHPFHVTRLKNWEKNEKKKLLMFNKLTYTCNIERKRNTRKCSFKSLYTKRVQENVTDMVILLSGDGSKLSRRKHGYFVQLIPSKLYFSTSLKRLCHFQLHK